MQSTVVCSMRNEGAFLLEWVVWYRMLGFQSVVAVTNDCTDRSGQLLGALQAAGWLRHLDVPIKAGRPGISTAKYRAAAALPEVAQAEAVLVCDVDEFLVIHAGEGRLADLIAAPGRDFLGMSINWCVFGSAGIKDYRDEPVHRQFLYCLPRQATLNRGLKSLFRHPGWWERLREHGPEGLNLRRAQRKAGCNWGEGELVWINPSGQVIPNWAPEGPYLQSVPPRMVDHKVAQMNHYMLRSAETFSVKRGTASPTAGRDRYTQAYWSSADRGHQLDGSALRHAEAFDLLWQQAMDLPGVAQAHDLCCADHVAQIAAKAGRSTDSDPRHAAFVARAAGRQG